MQHRKTVLIIGIVSLWLGTAFAYSAGPDPRLTGAPGDAAAACTACHFGTLNSGPGSVTIILPNGTSYQAGVTQHIKVRITDPTQRRWGFQLTARLASDLANGQAGDFNSSDNLTQVICDGTALAKPCATQQTVQFVEHTLAGTRNGTSGGVTFEFDWTPPASSENVTFYAAANAANGNLNEIGDQIYTTSVQLTSDSGAGQTGPPVAQGTRFIVHNLVSDMAGFAAQTDPNLLNPWGIALSPTGPFWLSNNHSGTATVYNTAGQPFPSGNALTVKIPLPRSGSSLSSPTGQVFNSTLAFEVAPGKPASFIFATEEGTISGWNSSVNAGQAVLMVDNSSNAVYKGLALAGNSSGPLLYAANFAAATIDVFDGKFQPVTAPGGFKDPSLPSGFAPFNIQKIGRRLLVTYALQDSSKHDDIAGQGNGFLNVFDTDGNLKQQLISKGPLNSPWGMTLAPQFFGDFSSTLLVGNFGDCHVNAFDLATGEFLGTLQDAAGGPLKAEGLWALQTGNGHNGGDSNLVYFTAGISGGGRIEDHGLFGSIEVAP